jgi:hypothetical protein
MSRRAQSRLCKAYLDSVGHGREQLEDARPSNIQLWALGRLCGKKEKKRKESKQGVTMVWGEYER